MNHALFFNESPLTHQIFDFSKLKLEELDQAIQEAMAKGKTAITSIAENSDQPTFDNTILTLETADEDLEFCASIMYVLLGCNRNDTLQNMVEKFSPQFANYSNEVLLNEKLFNRVKAVHELRDQGLTPEQKELVTKKYKAFVLNGALLPSDSKEKLKKIDEELSSLSPKFSKNVLDATNAFEHVTMDKDELAGIPASVLEAASEDAKAKGHKEGSFLFTLQFPSFIPVLRYAKNRSLREKLWRAHASRAFSGENANQELVLRICDLRKQKATLLGFENYAEFILQERMASSVSKVYDFLNELLDHALEPAKEDLKEVLSFAKDQDGLDDIMPWDFAYYSELIRQKKYDFDEEELKPFFSLEKSLTGMFEIARKLYGIKLNEIEDAPKYHEDVRVFEVLDEKNNYVGVFYCDFFPRESKSQGAWCTSFRKQGLFRGKVQRPHIAIVCNFTKPTSNTPSLLTFQEVRTLFHEFGHALHDLLSQCEYASLAGTNVLWDFVELPSQLMENWTMEKEALDIFAEHYKTGEKLPTEMIEKIKAAEKFQSGYFSVRQLKFAMIDMAWHTKDTSQVKNVEDFEKGELKHLNLLPDVPNTSFSCAFSHIFAGGYAAGYYSYKWAEVLDADAFEYFKEKGIFSEEVAKSMKENILTKGGTEHPSELYRKFRGKDPDVKALLRRDGLI